MMDTQKLFERKRFINRFCRLMGILERHKDDVLRNPIKYLDMAQERILKQRRLIDSLKDKAFVQHGLIAWTDCKKPQYRPPETIIVDKEDYDCLMAVRELLTNGDKTK